MIYTVTLNPAVDKTVYVDGFTLDAVNRATSVRQDPGGKGINVSKTIQALGGESTAFAVLGGPSGSFISDALGDMGIAAQVFDIPGTTRTNTKVVDLERGTYTDINEPGAQVTQELLDDALAILALQVAPGDIVVLSGSLPAGAPTNTYAAWTRAVRKAGARVFLDADGEVLQAGLAAKPSLVKPNEVELGRLLGRELTETQQIADAARELIEQGIDRAMVSMGAAGAVFATAEGTWRLKQPAVEVVSTVGAGDSVVAALAFAEAEGMALADAARLAMATGAATVMRPGTEAARRPDIDALLPQVTVEAL
ncbi:1-phosphofructokinase [Collinsella tanakaei]|uniref:1-phosphofructokinase n=1 Tax=Collinsella tanakaei TaxID=626935 RepID=UPI00195722F9|nr:1-phosphofructokinase [Collinsella tanakaei]